MPAPDAVLELVERFKNNIDSYKRPGYNETQVRREFIDPFFEAMGWDVANKKGYAEAYKEVVHEDAIKDGKGTRAPDYGFRVGGVRKFFLEAKSPSVNIKEDIHPAYQLRRYAWSAKLPLSILTDFEEFSVYDCRVKPVPTDKAHKSRVLYLKFIDYPEQWNEIAGIFSHEAILKGSFDKYVEEKKAKRGTAEVDKAFLQEIERWRELLARNIALRNTTLSTRELNFAVQRTIDRIIFLRICEDRSIEPYGGLLGFLNGPNIYDRLFQFFHEADRRYNSGLFHFRTEKDRPDCDTLTPGLHVDDNVLKDIIRNLYYPDSPYEFSVLPADILGQVYEQFLGKVIRLTPAHRAVVEDKPEVRKAGGVYYTPTYIVDYIVKNTVGKLLDGKKPGPRGTASKLRILDPACGSGSFLLGSYQFLLDWHRDRYVEDGAEKWAKGRSPRLHRTAQGDWGLTIEERKRILVNNIYGVDIDSQAVEVTKLSLLLKVLEGENEGSIVRQMSFLRERVLPDLGNNIKCGNSLIGPDFYEDRQLSLLDDEEVYRINAFDWEVEFPEIIKAGGFDAVIGNPPYGANFDKTTKAYLSKRYKHQGYQLESYLLFLEKANENILKEDGCFGMIIPNPWLTNLLQNKIRKFILENTKILEIVHFKKPVFPKSTVDTEIVVTRKGNPVDYKPVIKILNKGTTLGKLTIDSACKVIVHDQNQWMALDGKPISIFLSSDEIELANKIQNMSRELSNLCKINVGIKPYQVGKGKPAQTKQIVENRIYDSDREVDEYYRLYLRGRDINRYIISPLQQRYIKFGPWLAEPRPSANFDSQAKILMRQTGDKIIATIDTDQYLCLNNMHVIVPYEESPSIKYILGLLNSSLVNWFYQTLNPERGEALAEVKKTNVARLPIYLVDKTIEKEKAIYDMVVKLVVQMLIINKQFPESQEPYIRSTIQRQIETTDRQIDKLVYELYGLTEEEIKIVESSVG